MSTYAPILRVKRLHPDARIPTYAHVLDAGLDLHALEDTILLGASPVSVRTGIAIEIEPGYEGQIRGRSGLALKGILVVLGTIDAGYRGELSASVYSGPPAPWEYRIAAGDRIAQVARAVVIEVPELSSSERGERGFGSTGIKP